MFPRVTTVANTTRRRGITLVVKLPFTDQHSQEAGAQRSLAMRLRIRPVSGRPLNKRTGPVDAARPAVTGPPIGQRSAPFPVNQAALSNDYKVSQSLQASETITPMITPPPSSTMKALARHDRLIAIVGTAVLTVGFFYGVLRLGQLQAKALKVDVSQTRSLLTSLPVQIAEREHLQTKLEQRRKQSERLATMIPSLVDVSDVLHEVAQLAKHS